MVCVPALNSAEARGNVNTGLPELSYDGAAHRLRRSLAQVEPRLLSAPLLRPAAVLAPLLRRPHGPVFLFTQRRRHLQHHGGQVSFPGGRMDAGERPAAAALREAWEEVGLPSSHVELIGRLDDQPSPMRYRVTPLVGLVPEPPPLVPQPDEVTEMFEVPLARLLDPAAVHAEWWPAGKLPGGEVRQVLMHSAAGYREVDPGRQHYKVFFFDTGGGPDRVVWGLTARIVSQILEAAFGFIPPHPAATDR
jgi:8-oxo-dGTP pyrophosphatase MutT (NUDIX family)